MSDEKNERSNGQLTYGDMEKLIRTLRKHGDEVRIDYYRNGAMKRIRVYGVKNNDE